MSNTILIAIIIIGFTATIWFVRKMLADFGDRQQNDQSLLMLNQNMQGVQQRIDESTRALNERLDNAGRVIAGVSKELGQLHEMGTHMRELQDFLKSPKLRGNIGEQVMRDLLEQYFSREHFEIQHKFNDGQIVDALLKTDKGTIPIDSKFPMENFTKFARAEIEEERATALHEFFKDVRKHIADIAKKYILPSEGTVDFAVMYIPSEAVYYEILRSEEDVNKYAHEKKVFLVSPNSFYYFLKILLIGMEGKKLEENIKQVQVLLQSIHQDATRFSDALSVLNTHVTNSKNAIDRVNTEYAKLSGKIDQVKLLK